MELKPCPFCGSNEILNFPVGMGQYECQTCLARAPHDTWEKRFQPPVVEAREWVLYQEGHSQEFKIYGPKSKIWHERIEVREIQPPSMEGQARPRPEYNAQGMIINDASEAGFGPNWKPCKKCSGYLFKWWKFCPDCATEVTSARVSPEVILSKTLDPLHDNGCQPDRPILVVMHWIGAIQSYGEGRRLIDQGAVKVDSASITSEEALVQPWHRVLKVGNREWLIKNGPNGTESKP